MNQVAQLIQNKFKLSPELSEQIVSAVMNALKEQVPAIAPYLEKAGMFGTIGALGDKVKGLAGAAEGILNKH